jgi:acyl-CoA synthetase (AMP-forming)/AMP-acid ligase II
MSRAASGAVPRAASDAVSRAASGDISRAMPGDGFLARLEATARAQPDRLAVAGPGVALTHGALAGLVRGMAAWLLRAGLAPGAMAGVTLRDDLPHLVVTLALLRLGCHQVTLGSHEPLPRRADLGARAGVALVLGDGPEDALPGLPLLRPDLAAAGEAPAAPLPEAAQDDALLVMTSSGTTGRPKLIPLTQAQLLAQSLRRAGLGRVRHRPVGLEHNNGMRFPLFALANGDTHVLAAASRAEGLAETCRRYGVDMLGLAPHQAESLLASRREGTWPAGTSIDLAGAAPGDGLVQRLQAALTAQVFTLYGTSEVGSVARAGPADHAAHPGGAGRVLPTAEAMVVDGAGAPLPAGEAGLLRLRTTGMAQRYLGDDEATARCFVGGWFQPGDLGRLLPDGTLVVLGRADEMMLLGSLNIFPAEIEAVAAGFPGLADCAAFARRSATQGDIPMLAAVESAPGSLDAAALLAACRDRLGVRAPRRVVLVPALPRNAAGKVMRHLLPPG